MNNGEVGGSRGRGRGWKHPENTQPSKLRPPKNSVVEEVKVEPQLTVKSNLSAEAKEWYPPNYVPQSVVTYSAEPTQFRPPRFSVQNRISQARDQDAFNFGEMTYSIDEIPNPYLRDNIGNLINVMCEITLDPGKFDKLCSQIVDAFIGTLSDANYTKPLVEAIVNQSIAESNFRYNGARLCSMYDSLGTPEESTFRACLLERCSAEEHKIITGIETSEENMRGFAMFLAEIYTQLEDNQGGRIKSLGESLCKVLSHLLDTNKEVNIKAVCQLLKLSGLALDADCPTSMLAAFERLKRRSELPCVRSVVALRAARWGLADAEPAHEPAAHRQLPIGMTSNGEPESVYLADGQVLTAEEAAFLHHHLPDKPCKDEILHEIIEDWEMDDEMHEGFLEFLRISNQIKQ